MSPTKVIVTAHPVREGSLTSEDALTSSPGQADIAQATDSTSLDNLNSRNNLTHLCRRCGARFRPPVGATGTAAAYRCADCNTFSAFCEDLPYMLCTIQ